MSKTKDSWVILEIYLFKWVIRIKMYVKNQSIKWIYAKILKIFEYSNNLDIRIFVRIFSVSRIYSIFVFGPFSISEYIRYSYSSQKKYSWQHWSVWRITMLSVLMFFKVMMSTNLSIAISIIFLCSFTLIQTQLAPVNIGRCVSL